MSSKILNNVRVIQKCIVVRDDGRILALKRAADDHSRGGSWDLPGGGYEEGEQVVEAVIREVQEEAGLVVRQVRPLYIANHMDIKEGFFAGLNVFGVCYVSTEWSGEVVISDEHAKYMWLTVEEFTDLDFGADNGFFKESIDMYKKYHAQ